MAITSKNPASPQARPTSLRAHLLRRLLPAILLLLVAGAGTAYWIALHSATRAYDRALLDTTLAIVEQIRIVDGKPVLPLTSQAKAILLTDKFDEIFYAVRGTRKQLLDGDSDLPQPPVRLLGTLQAEGRLYYDGTLRGRPIRVAALRSELEDHVFTVLAGETLVKREALFQEIILGMLVPELLLTLITLTVLWFGIRSGLTPLAGLRQELAGRSHADLSPINSEVPEELAPVAHEINSLFARLERSLVAQRHFVSDAAHQLRTPIAALLAQVELAIRGCDLQSAARLESIVPATQRLAYLVEQLLALARAEASPADPLPEVSLPDVAHAVAEARLPLAIRKGTDLGFNLSPMTVRGNRLLLEELLANLVDNALHHTPAGSVVTVSCGRDEEGVFLCVEDDGPGIPEGERGKIFERFHQCPGSAGNGSGLGLAIVQEIARQHGGSVAVDTSPTLGGARFVVRFPDLAAAG